MRRTSWSVDVVSPTTTVRRCSSENLTARRQGVEISGGPGRGIPKTTLKSSHLHSMARCCSFDRLEENQSAIDGGVLIRALPVVPNQRASSIDQLAVSANVVVVPSSPLCVRRD